MMPDLLFLAQRLPYPPDKGEKIRSFHILQYLARFYDIHLGALIDDPADRQGIEALAPLCRDIHVAQIDKRLQRVAALRGLLTNEALSVLYFYDPGLAAWVRHVLATIRPAVTFVSSSNMAPYILDLAGRGRWLADLVDVDSEKWHALAETARGLRRFVYRREARRISDLEQRIAQHCDTLTFVSSAEAALFTARHHHEAACIRSISNGVDHHYFDPARHHSPAYDTTRPNFVFTGTMDYPPNVDAVRWFATEIWPCVHRRLPAAQFHIVGKTPNRAVRRLARIDGVFVSGSVPDVRPYIAHATASVAPMRIARGIQNKVLEAMAMARPVVLTPGALEGIRTDPGVEVIVAESAAAFAAACCRMATTNDGAAIGAAARLRILRDYDWSVTLRGLADILALPVGTAGEGGAQAEWPVPDCCAEPRRQVTAAARSTDEPAATIPQSY